MSSEGTHCLKKCKAEFPVREDGPMEETEESLLAFKFCEDMTQGTVA